MELIELTEMRLDAGLQDQAIAMFCRKLQGLSQQTENKGKIGCCYTLVLSPDA